MNFRRLIIYCLRIVRVTSALTAMLSVVEADPITAFAATWYGAMIVSAAISAASYGVEYLLTPKPKQGNIDLGRNDAIQLAFSGYGAGIPIIYGRMQVGPLWFWNTPIKHTQVTSAGTGGGKGLPHATAPTQTTHIYSVNLAGLLCEGPISSVIRIWIGTDLVYNAEASGAARYEAEAGGNTLAGGASVATCSSCSGGHKVTGIGSGGSLQFNGVAGSSISGDSDLAIFYTSTADHTMKMSVDGGATVDVVCPSSGGAGVVAIVSAQVTLSAGNHTIKFSNAGAACPDIDKIEVAPPLVLDPGGPCPLGQHPDPDTGLCVTDHILVTGAFNENVIPSTNDPDVSWPFYNYSPPLSASVGGPAYSMNLSKYGQPSIRIYQGTETQTADSAIIADKGIDHAPAYRGYSYIVFEGLQLPNGDSGLINTVRVEVDQGVNSADLIVADLYDRVGVDSANVDVTALDTDTLVGFIIPSRQQASKAVTDLQTCFQFDMVEIDGKVVAVKRNGSSVANVSYTDLRAFIKSSPDDKGPEFDMLIADMDELTLPERVDVQYLDPATDYHQNTQSDMALTGSAGDQISVTLPIAMSADQAKQLAITLRVKPWLEGRTFTWTEGPKSYKYNPGDVKTYTLQSGTQHTIRITKQSLMLPIGVAEYEGVRQSASLYSPTGSGSVGSGYEPPVAGHPANSKGVFIDGPLLRPEDGGDGTAPVVYIASCVRATGQGNGGGLYLEDPIGSGVYALVTTYDQQSGIGVSNGALATVTDPTVLDSTHSLEINFISLVELSSASGADLLANPGLNLLWIGSEGYGEYIQFETAVAGTAAAPYLANYTISNLYRGRFGTENEVGIHTSSDDVVVMDSTIKPRRMNVDDIGVARSFKWVTSGQAEPDAVAVPFTLVGRSLQPLAVSDIVTNIDGFGDFLTSFTPHTRRGEEPATFSIDVYDSTFTTFKGKLPVTAGTTHACLLNSVHISPDGGSVGNPPDEDPIPGGVGTVITSAATDKNNAFSLPFDGGEGVRAGWPCSWVTLESIDSTFQRFDFSPQWLGADGLGDLDVMVIGLQIRANADPVSDVFDPVLASCVLSVTYSAGTLTGTVKETYKTGTTTLYVRDNVNAGFGEGSSIDDYIVHRSGPRTTFAVVGNEYRAYLNFGSQNQRLIAVVSAPAAGPTYPLRLCGNTGSTRTASKAVLNITRGGDQLSTIYSVANQIKFEGSQQSRVYLRIYQDAKDPLPNGVVTDIIVPPL